MGNKLKKFISIILLAIMFTPTVVIKADDIDEDVKKVQEQYEQMNQEIIDLENQIMQKTADIESLSIEITNKETEINEYQDKINDMNIKIEENNAKLQEIQAKLDSRVLSIYKDGGIPDYISFIFTSKNFSDLLLKLESSKRIIKNDKALMTEINSIKDELEKENKELEDTKSLLDESLIILEENKNTVENEKNNLSNMVVEQSEKRDAFEKEYLEVSERTLIQPQRDLIEGENMDLNTIKNAVSQLASIIKSLKSQTIKNEANDLITKGNNKINKIEADLKKQQANINKNNNTNNYNNNTINNNTNNYIPEGNNTVSSSVTGSDIVSFAYNFLGTPYVYGAVGPDTFDCSGFTSYVYRHCAGIEITRTTYTQRYQGVSVAYSDMQPGDLVFTYGYGHVGIYVGNGQYINAPYEGVGVKVMNITSFDEARRIIN